MITPPLILLPRSGITSDELGVVVNINDPNSVAVAEYYMRRRGIPTENRFDIAFDPQQTSIKPNEFRGIYERLNQYFSDDIQALALTWASPYRVGCMSISAAFTFGFDSKYCANGCKLTASSGYYNHATTSPYNHLQIRPTMMIAAGDLTSTLALIDRGIMADGQLYQGDAYLLKTSDKNRSVRELLFPKIKKVLGERLKINDLEKDAIRNKDNILFYFTGVSTVKFLDSLTFTPGAVADHLTSFGGKLTDSHQMSILRWLDAGATGSYGSVTEPCNFLEKFPHPGVVMEHYLRGGTLIESYWKSVDMPGQGNFVGEPLASPFRGYHLDLKNGMYRLSSPLLSKGTYFLEAANDMFSTYTVLGRFVIDEDRPYLTIAPPFMGIYRISFSSP